MNVLIQYNHPMKKMIFIIKKLIDALELEEL